MSEIEQPYILGHEKIPKWPHATVILATPPSSHVISYGKRAFNLDFPWLVWKMDLNTVNMGNRWRLRIQISNIWMIKEAPTLKKCPLYAVPLPNIYIDGRICLGQVAYIEDTFDASITGILSKALDTFWGSSFNSDITGPMLQCFAGKNTKSVGNCLRSWEKDFSGLPWKNSSTNRNLYLKDALNALKIKKLRRTRLLRDSYAQKGSTAYFLKTGRLPTKTII